MKTKTVGIREAKARLSQLLRELRPADVVIITDRGRPVARLLPPTEQQNTFEERLRRLVSEGWIEPVGKRARRLAPAISAPVGLAQKYLQEDRDR